MTYGIIFWGSPLGPTIFRLQKKAIRIMEGCGNRISCRDLFRKFHILPLASQYLLSLLMFVMQHKYLFITSMDSHNLETRQINNLYTPQSNLSVYQKGAYYSGEKIFNKLPSNIKNVNGNITKFKTTSKMFICELILHARRVFWAIMALVLSMAYLKIFLVAYLSIRGFRIFVFL
jgi:hypothetical protein